MSSKRRSLQAGERVRVGRHTISVPSVPSMTDRSPAAPPPTPDDGESERPTDEPTEELARMMKAACR
jgi:hypothetical protein